MIRLLSKLSTPKLAAFALAAGLALGSASAWWIGSLRLEAAEGRYEALKGQHAEAVRISTEEHDKELERQRGIEQGLRADLDSIQAQHAKEKDHAKTKADRVIADLRSGNRRLSVAVRSCSAAQAGEAGRGAAAAGGGQEARAELDGEAAARIVGVTDEGDDAIRDLNTCVDAYEAVRARINSQLTSPAQARPLGQ